MKQSQPHIKTGGGGVSPLPHSWISLKQEYVTDPKVNIIDCSKMSRPTETQQSAAVPEDAEISATFSSDISYHLH